MPGSQYYPSSNGAINAGNAFIAATQADMLASNASDNDTCFRTDTTPPSTWTLIDTPANILANWKMHPVPAATPPVNQFVSLTTSGIADWNNISNTQPGVTARLMTSTDANGPSSASAQNGYYHCQNIEFGSSNGTGQIRQIAWPYGNMTSGDIFTRGRYLGSWTGWTKVGGAGTPRITYAYQNNGQTFTNNTATDIVLANQFFVGAAFGTWTPAGVFTFAEAGTYKISYQCGTNMSSIAATSQTHSVLIKNPASGVTYDASQTIVQNTSNSAIKSAGNTILNFSAGNSCKMQALVLCQAGFFNAGLLSNSNAPTKNAELIIEKIA